MARGPSAAPPARADVVLILGPDSFLAEEALEQALAAAVGGDRDDSVRFFRGEETGWLRVVEAARTGSLFATRRAVVVRQAELLKGDGEEALAYLEDPAPGVVLILLAAKPDRRRTVWKKLVERGSVRSAEPLKGRALRAYVSERIRRSGLTLRDDALDELMERVGQDLRRLMGELDKLQCFAGERTSLGPEEVAAVLGRGFAQPLYKLADAFSERRPAAALALAEALLDEGEEALKVLGALHRSLRQMQVAVSLRSSRIPREQMAARLGLPPPMAFKLPAILDAARAWNEDSLRTALDALWKADRRLKTGGQARVALTAALAEACGGGAPTSARPGR